MEKAGLATVGLVESDSDSAKTLESNRPRWRVINRRVEDMDWSSFKGVDVVSGGFPCQAFSYAGKSLGFNDPRGGLVFEMFRCIREVQPKVVLAENVLGLASHRKGETLATILKGLRRCGYKVHTKVVNARDYRVPQKRKRFLIIGKLNEHGMDFPDFPKPSSKKFTLKSALKDCPPSLGAEYPAYKQKVMSLVPEGGCWVDLPDAVQRKYMGAAYGHNSARGGRRGMARRLAWDEPSLTILCSPAQKQTERCHPEETRPLTIRESARIQTFPDNWEFIGSLSSQYRQIGNAVPVKLGKIIGEYIKWILE